MIGERWRPRQRGGGSICSVKGDSCLWECALKREGIMIRVAKECMQCRR